MSFPDTLSNLSTSSLTQGILLSIPPNLCRRDSHKHTCNPPCLLSEQEYLTQQLCEKNCQASSHQPSRTNNIAQNGQANNNRDEHGPRWNILVNHATFSFLKLIFFGVDACLPKILSHPRPYKRGLCLDRSPFPATSHLDSCIELTISGTQQPAQSLHQRIGYTKVPYIARKIQKITLFPICQYLALDPILARPVERHQPNIAPQRDRKHSMQFHLTYPGSLLSDMEARARIIIPGIHVLDSPTTQPR